MSATYFFLEYVKILFFRSFDFDVARAAQCNTILKVMASSRFYGKDVMNFNNTDDVFPSAYAGIAALKEAQDA